MKNTLTHPNCLATSYTICLATMKPRHWLSNLMRVLGLKEKVSWKSEVNTSNKCHRESQRGDVLTFISCIYKSKQKLLVITDCWLPKLTMWKLKNLIKPCVTVWMGRSQWPSGLRSGSAAACLLGLRVQIPPRAWMFVCCECCVLSGRGLCNGLITRPEESYWLCCVIVCDIETSRMRRLKPASGLWKPV
jgi:hypothetical protein